MPTAAQTFSLLGKEFKVLEILSDTRLVIGAGVKDGITSNTQFFIFGLGDIIRDENGRQYEALELIRGRAKVIHVQNTICTVESLQSIQKDVARPGSAYFHLAGIAGSYQTITVPKPFVDVAVGDLARVIAE